MLQVGSPRSSRCTGVVGYRPILKVFAPNRCGGHFKRLSCSTLECPTHPRDDFKSRVLATWHPTVRSLAMAINLTSTAIILALAISGCSSTNYGAASLLADPSGDPTQEPPCGRLESAYYLSTVGFRATEYIAESCVNDPHLVNCNLLLMQVTRNTLQPVTQILNHL